MFVFTNRSFKGVNPVQFRRHTDISDSLHNYMIGIFCHQKLCTRRTLHFYYFKGVNIFFTPVSTRRGRVKQLYHVHIPIYAQVNNNLCNECDELAICQEYINYYNDQKRTKFWKNLMTVFLKRGHFKTRTFSKKTLDIISFSIIFIIIIIISIIIIVSLLL